MANNGYRPGRSVTSKVLRVLDAFTAERPVLSLGELARSTAIPVSTTYRLVSELVDGGGLEHVEGGGYRVGLRLWEIGSLAPISAGLPQIVVPFMQDLYEATHENLQLAVLKGHAALYIEKILGRDSVAVKSRRGGRLPLHATGVGKVLLANSPQPFIEEVFAAGLRRYTPHTVIAPGLLLESLAEIRRTGVAFAREEMTVGTLSVASPLTDADDNVVRPCRSWCGRPAPISTGWPRRCVPRSCAPPVSYGHGRTTWWGIRNNRPSVLAEREQDPSYRCVYV